MRLSISPTKVIILITSLLFALTAKSDVLDSDNYYDFVKNGINYRIKRVRGIDGSPVKTDSVTIVGGVPDADGVLDIPSHVEFSGEKYVVYEISNAFKDCETIKRLILPPTISEIGYQAFFRCKNLEQVTFSEGLIKLGYRAFSRCVKLESLSLPQSLTIIDCDAFEHCKSLKQVVLPDNVTRIQLFAFQYCSNLEKATLGKNLQHLNIAPFNKCKKLKTITCLSLTPPEGLAFWEAKEARKVTLYVPAASVEAYRTHKDWRNFGKILPLAD